MPPERFPPDDPREWLNRARSNLAQARAHISEVYLEDLCFDAQQAAEKAIKALLLHRGVKFPYTHDLADLLTLLLKAEQKLPPKVNNAARLTRFAIVTRYPGLSEPVTEAEYQDAIGIAEAVLRWAEQRIEEGK